MRGSKPGERRGGRQPGAKNKRTRELEAAQAEIAAKIEEALGEAAFEGDAHALLTMVYKDRSQPLELRLEAARAALPFEKPRLSSIDARIKTDDFEWMTDEELNAEVARGFQKFRRTGLLGVSLDDDAPDGKTPRRKH